MYLPDEKLFTNRKCFFPFIASTVAMTSHPSNESELQLYRVLQRANLLAYYDTFICQGRTQFFEEVVGTLFWEIILLLTL